MIDWRFDLTQFIKGLKGKPFEWGVNDCMTLISGAAYAITGVPMPAGYFPSYSTKKEALAVCRRISPASVFGKYLEFSVVPSAFAQFGDIGILKQNCLWKGAIFTGKNVVQIGVGSPVEVVSGEPIKLINSLVVIRFAHK